MSDIKFWRDREKRILDPALFAEKADQWAKSVFDERLGDTGKKDMNKPTQLRRFYDEVVRFDTTLKSVGNADPEDFERQLPYIRMLNAKAHYAKAREHVSDRFVVMIESCLKQVETSDDLEAFKSFFEAFMGYYRYYHPKNN